MNDSRAVALAFIACWSEGIASLRAAIDTYFTEKTVWENVGLNRLVGKAQARAFVEKYHLERGLDAIDVEMTAILSDERHVMTERVDTLRRADGGAVHAVRIMGIFEIEDGKIIAQRDYFFPAGA